MEILTKANAHETIYFMKYNSIEKGEVQEISAKVFATLDGDNVKIRYKVKLSSGVIDTEWHDEARIFLTSESLINNLRDDIS